MSEQSSELQGLKGAIARAALAVFAFVALTGLPLLARAPLAGPASVQVAAVADSVGSSPAIEEGVSCEI